MKHFYYQKVKSTQDLAKEYIVDHKEVACFIAEEQTAGYGKRNRSFYSPANSGIYFSLALPNFDFKTEQASILTPAIAVYLLLTLKKFYPEANLQIKWVNDLYLQDKKVAGILTEKVATGLVIGVGINLNTEKFPQALGVKVGSISSQNISLNRKQQLLKALIRATLVAVKISDTQRVLELYRKFSNLLGKHVVLQVGKKSYTGKVLTIDDQARLVIESNNQVIAFASGEVIRTILDK